MRYGESSHEAKEFDDDDDIEDYSQEIVKIKPKRLSNIPNGLAMLKPQDFTIRMPDTNNVRMASHDSTPGQFEFPNTSPSRSINVKSATHDSMVLLKPKPGEIFFMKKKKLI
jgi:hypothetical protein